MVQVKAIIYSFAVAGFLLVKPLQSQNITIYFDSNKTSQRFASEAQLFILHGDSAYRLKRLSDTTFTRPIITDSSAMRNRTYIKMKAIWRRNCFTFDADNVLYGHKRIQIKVYRSGLLKRRIGLVISEGNTYHSPILSICGKSDLSGFDSTIQTKKRKQLSEQWKSDTFGCSGVRARIHPAALLADSSLDVIVELFGIPNDTLDQFDQGTGVLKYTVECGTSSRPDAKNFPKGRHPVYSLCLRFYKGKLTYCYYG